MPRPRRLLCIVALVAFCVAHGARAQQSDDALSYPDLGSDSGLFDFITTFLTKSPLDQFDTMWGIARRIRPWIPAGRLAAASEDAADGALVRIPATLAACPGHGGAAHPNGRFVYVASDFSTPGQVCAYRVDTATGALTPVPGQPFAAGVGTRALAIDSSGRFLYAVNFDDETLSAFRIDRATGALSPIAGASSATGKAPRAVEVAPNGRFVYVVNQQGGNVTGFAADPSTGALAPLPGSPYATAPFPIGLAMDPRGRFVFVAAGTLQTLAIDAATGALRVVAATGDILIRYVAADPAGRYVYGSSEFDGPGGVGRVTPYAVAADGTLTLAGPRVAAGMSTGTLVVDRFARYVYATNLLDGTTSGFAIDAATGALAAITGSPFATGANIGIGAGGSLPAGSAWESGRFFYGPLGASGGRPPYAWQVAAGSLPPGLALDGDLGALRGVPSTPGTATFTLRVSDATGAAATRAYTLEIRASDTAPTATVVEFYHAALDHYFITWHAAEIAALDAGTVIKGWARTGREFPVYTLPTAATSPVCRYYIPPAQGDSHFFGRGTVECAATGKNHPAFVLEDAAFMHMVLPTAGVCAAGTVAVYRVFSNRPDANHRYTTDKAVRDQMVARGWLAEGDGPDLVVMCAPG